MTREIVIQELAEQGKNTVRKQKLALTKWINDVNYILDHLDSQKDQRSVPIHLGTEYRPKAIRELRAELKVYQDLREELTPAKLEKPMLVDGMFVIAPCKLPKNSTFVKGGRYEVSEVTINKFGTYSFIAEGHFCLLVGCAHLKFNNWIIEKPITRQMKRKKQ